MFVSYPFTKGSNFEKEQISALKKVFVMTNFDVKFDFAKISSREDLIAGHGRMAYLGLLMAQHYT